MELKLGGRFSGKWEDVREKTGGCLMANDWANEVRQSASEASEWDFNEVECRTSVSTDETVEGENNE
ncbi:hypothetical protein FP803_05085 [Candidatus Woesearchaeota archaeon]|nr:hypothetical protein [Candidatus Woesearchaeota archaeon]